MSISLPLTGLGAPSTSAPLNLSKATHLKRVAFRVGTPSVRWIATALQTAKSKNLQQITIYQEAEWLLEIPGAEEPLSEWQHLDRILVQFWTSHSIRPQLFDPGNHLGDFIPNLFPGLTGRGLLDKF